MMKQMRRSVKLSDKEEDGVDIGAARNAFDALLFAAEGKDSLATENDTVGLYQRSAEFSDRHKRRKLAAVEALKQEARSSKSLSYYGFRAISSESTASATIKQRQDLDEKQLKLQLAISKMETKLKSRKVGRQIQNSKKNHRILYQLIQVSKCSPPDRHIHSAPLP